VAPKQAIDFLRTQLMPVPLIDGKQLARLIDDLDSDTYARREKATEQLERLGGVAGLALHDTLKRKPSLELRRRVENLLAKLDPLDPPADTLRIVRAVQALELIGSPEASAFLEHLASGAAGARLTEEARASWHRLQTPGQGATGQAN
jgi:hypothetical protein